eukprot:g5361.t1
MSFFDACAKDALGVVKWYVEIRGQDLDDLMEYVFPRRGRKKCTACYVCAFFNAKRSLEYLVRSGADPDKVDPASGGATPLFISVWQRSVDCLRVLIRTERCNLNATSRTGLTAIHLAAREGARRCMKILLNVPRGGIDLNKADRWGTTPVKVAVINQDARSLRLIIASGANPSGGVARQGSHPSVFSKSPLHLAVGQGLVEMTQILLAAGADPNAQDSSGETPIFSFDPHKRTTSYVFSRRCVGILLGHGANPTHLNFAGQTWAQRYQRAKKKRGMYVMSTSPPSLPPAYPTHFPKNILSKGLFTLFDRKGIFTLLLIECKSRMGSDDVIWLPGEFWIALLRCTHVGGLAMDKTTGASVYKGVFGCGWFHPTGYGVRFGS